MAKYIRYEDIAKYPIRASHCDKENANEHFIFGIESVMKYIENLPKVEVDDTEVERERKHGYWEKIPRTLYFENGYECYCYKCSICGEEMDDYRPNYCPYCGARMDEKKIMTKILKCPKCGAEHLCLSRVEFTLQDPGFIKEFNIPNDGFLYQIECKCGRAGAPMYTIEDAVKAWNEIDESILCKFYSPTRA